MVTKKATRGTAKKRASGENDLAGLQELPLLPIRNTVLMPNVVTPLMVGRDQSIKAIEAAMSRGRLLFVVTQKNEDLEDPGPEDVHTIGVEAVVDRVLKLPDGTTSVLIHGQRRLRRLHYSQITPFMRVYTEAVHEDTERTLAVEALMRATLALFEKCIKLSSTLPDEAFITAMNIDKPGWLADFIVGFHRRHARYIHRHTPGHIGSLQRRRTLAKDLHPALERAQHSRTGVADSYAGAARG